MRGFHKSKCCISDTVSQNNVGGTQADAEGHAFVNSINIRVER